MERIKLKPLTEEDKSLVRKFFEKWETGGLGKWRLFFMYWRMRAQGERIPQAEAILERQAQLKMDSYRNSKNLEILRGLKAYENEHQEAWAYEVMRINHWDNGRTLIIGILDQRDKKVVHSHVIEIVESLNPDYFKECIMKYAPNQALSSDKPF